MSAVMESFEEWQRSEISRLRADAQRASAEADTLQRSLDKWLQSQGASPSNGAAEADGVGAAHTPRRRRRQATYGSKNAAALELIKEAPGGLSMDGIFESFVEMYGASYKRSSLRALLWNQKEKGIIENRNGRYVIAAKEQST
jgi:hypothetical protein